jgi:hypothetical protein
MYDSSSPAAIRSSDFDDAFGQSADVAYVTRPGGHADEATALLADPTPTSEAKINAVLGMIEDDRTVSESDRINHREGQAAAKRLLAHFTAGCTWSAWRETKAMLYSDGEIRLTVVCTLMIWDKARNNMLACGTGATFEEASVNTLSDAATRRKVAEAQLQTLAGSAA